MLELIASLTLVFGIYWLGSLALTQQFLNPKKLQKMESVFGRILVLSIVMAMFPTMLFYLFILSE